MVSKLCLLFIITVTLYAMSAWRSPAFSDERVSIRSADGSVQVRFPKSDRGLFCDTFTIALGDETVEYSGFTCQFVRGDTTFKDAQWTNDGSRLTVEHRLTDGNAIRGELWIDDATRAIRCRFAPLDNVAKVEVGGLRSKVRRLYCDSGWVVEHPSNAHTRSRLMTDFIVVERDDGWIELQAADMSSGYRFDPKDNRCSLFTLYRVPETTVTIMLGRTGVSDIVRNYRRIAEASAPATISKLAHRFLLDDWTGGPTQNTIAELERLRYYGCTRFLVLFHNWQHYGYDVKLPDIFPPHRQAGGTEGIRKLAEYCRDRDIAFGLHDNYSDIYPDAPSFKQDYAALRPKEWRKDEPYHRGWFNQGTGITAYAWAPDAALDVAKRNFEMIGKAFPITAYFLDVTSYCDPKPYERPDGVFHSPAEDLRLGRALYDLARTSYGGAPVVGEGCTEKFLGAVDAAGCDLWSADRWGIDPGAKDWEFYPLFNLAFHPDVILYGVGYPGRYKSPDASFEADIWSEQALDDYRSTRILFGNSGFWQTVGGDLSMDDARIIKEYYLSVPLAEQIERIEMVSLTPVDNNIHRLRAEYANGVTVWVNRAFRPWKVEELVLPQYGVMVKGKNFFQGTLAMNNARVDIMDAGSILLLDGRGRLVTYRDILTDGAVAIEKRADDIVVRPIDRVTFIGIDFRKLVPERDFSKATVTMVGWNDKALREFSLDDGILRLDERTPLRQVVDKPAPGSRKPFGYYPYYVVTPERER